MSRKRIRIGVAGLGRIGWHFHCATLGEHRDFDLVAVVDTDADRRAEAEAVHGCRAFRTFDEMLAEAEIEAVTIATPTHLHKPHALAAFRRGVHVLLEKPMAIDLVEARTIVRAATRAERVLTVYQPARAHAGFQHILRIVQSGILGQVYHVRAGRYCFRRRDDWQALAKYGGGMLANFGAHSFDQVLLLTGCDVKRVYCNLRRVASLGDAEDVVKVLYETRSGIIGEVDINEACAMGSYEFEVFGTAGVLAKEGNCLKVKYFSPKRLKSKKLDTRLISPGRKYPRDDVCFKEKRVRINPRYQVDIYKDLAQAIRTGKPPFVPPKQTLAVMKLTDQCREDGGKIITTTL